MAQLYYKYGTMNSGKTIEILKVAHNYEEQGKPVVIMTSALDTRDGFGVVSSRIGMRREAVPISSDMDVFTFIDQLEEKPYCVLIDEIKTICQYCSKKATMVLRTENGKPVYEGAQIQIGGNETYIPVCRKHYFHPPVSTEQSVMTEKN